MSNFDDVHDLVLRQFLLSFTVMLAQCDSQGKINQ